MFDNFLRVLGKGKPESVQIAKLWDDLDDADICVMDMPETVSLDWLVTTDWYQSGGWREVRRAAYGSMELQLDMQYHGTWQLHVVEVKALWPKEVVVEG